MRFKTTLFEVNSWVIALLPDDVSKTLPSRGPVMVKGTINNFEFQTALEPDGWRSHWLHVTKSMQKAANIHAGDTVTLEIEPMKTWPEPPEIPADVQKALNEHPEMRELWQKITPLARWEWIRWIGATGRSETRTNRIDVARSKMANGERRPCCFNRTACCVPEVSKSGVLIKPDSLK